MVTTALLLARLRFSIFNFSSKCVIPHSALSLGVIKVLRRHNLVYGAATNHWRITMYLRYFRGRSVVNNVKVISKASRHLYLSNKAATKLASYHPALVFLVSNSRGVLSQCGLSKSIKSNSRSADNTVGANYALGGEILGCC